MPEFGSLTRKILWARGYQNKKAVQELLYPAPEVSFAPESMKGMNEAVEIILEAIKKKEKIAIFGDYDADGVTATAVLTLGLRTLGIEVVPYIPLRLDEGYGLNSEALVKLEKQGVNLVISCDCGTNAVEVVEGKPKNLKLVITDHHSPETEIAKPEALINPHQKGCEYPYKELSGAGVAYKLLQGVVNKGGGDVAPLASKMDQLLELVAIGAIQDSMPLIGENRYLVIKGLEMMQIDPLPGIAALIKRSGLKYPITATSVSFQLGPRINAAGRMSDAKHALNLLLTENEEEGRLLADGLEEHNQARKDATLLAEEQANEALAAQKEVKGAIVLADERWPQGIVGLIAGRLAESYKLPTFILNKGEAESHGSARSVEGFNVVEALRRCSDLLLRYGGHEMAAGLTCENKNLEALKKALSSHALEMEPEIGWKPHVDVDAEIAITELSRKAIEELSLLEPFGQGNPSPIFCIRGAHITDSGTVGADGAHLKLKLGDGTNTALEAMAWRKGHLLPHYKKGIKLDVLVSASVREFRGKTSVQLELQDVQKHKAIENVAGQIAKENFGMEA